MKKILFFAACVASFVACSEAQKPVELYCDQEVSRLYNDPNAEMDTLSYAAGMNIGLVVSLQNADFELETEAMIAILEDEFKIAYVDDKDLEEHNKFLEEFSIERVRPYMMAKQANARVATDCPDTLSLPALYDETYTKERFTKAFAPMMANSVRQQRMKANLHWVFEAMRDASNVKTKEDIDTYMRVTEQEFFTIMNNYMYNELPAYTAELAEKWFERVSTKEGVQAIVDDNGNKTGVYYRINNAGGDVKPVNATDSIAVKYAVYSRTGKLLESNEMFIDNLKKNREQVENNTMMPDSMRQKYLKQIDDEIANSAIRKLSLNTFMQVDVQNALKLIGNEGSITIWMNAAKALGYRANRMLPMNEAVVVNVELLDVKTVKPTPQPVTNHITVPAKGNNNKVAPQGKAALKRPEIVPVKK
jgi:hypothetical protein